MFWKYSEIEKKYRHVFLWFGSPEFFSWGPESFALIAHHKDVVSLQTIRCDVVMVFMTRSYNFKGCVLVAERNYLYSCIICRLQGNACNWYCSGNTAFTVTRARRGGSWAVGYPHLHTMNCHVGLCFFEYRWLFNVNRHCETNLCSHIVFIWRVFCLESSDPKQHFHDESLLKIVPIKRIRSS